MWLQLRESLEHLHKLWGFINGMGKTNKLAAVLTLIIDFTLTVTIP